MFSCPISVCIANRNSIIVKVESQVLMCDKLNKYDITDNTSKVYYNGSTWENNSGEHFSIVARLNEKTKGGSYYYLCRFEDGNIVKASSNHICDGQIKNRYTPSLYGVGYIGEGKWKANVNYQTTKEYNLWTSILGRCYNKKDKDYCNYGGKGVTVDKRWHNFQNFCDDILTLNGYNEWKNGKLEYALDKDIICDKKNIYPKIYSRDTCMFIRFNENSIYSSYTHKVYIGHRISDGYEEEFLYVKQFADKYGLCCSSIKNCLKDSLKSHRGWRFRVK